MLRMQIPLLLICFLSGVLSENCENSNSELCASKNAQQQSLQSSVYDFHALDILGNDVDLNKYRGHVLIIVNVASNCGLTDTNYKQLVQLYKKYANSGLRILAFPSNQFGGQEPGTSQDILNFVRKYNVTFDMFEKIDVNGDNAHPLWKWLTKLDGPIKWNFTKFVINKEGNIVARFAPNQEPLNLEPVLQENL